jgi:hypothetical protein
VSGRTYFDAYRRDVVASLRRPGSAKAFSLTTRTSHAAAEAALGAVTASVLIVIGERDRDFPDPKVEAGWIAKALHGEVVMVPEAGHYPQSQRPEITGGAILDFLASRLRRIATFRSSEDDHECSQRVGVSPRFGAGHHKRGPLTPTSGAEPRPQVDDVDEPSAVDGGRPP